LRASGALSAKKTEIGSTPDGGLLHEADGLAAVHTLHQGDFLRPLHDLVRQVVEQFFARGPRHVAPVGEGGPGGFTGGVDIRRAAGDHLPQRAVIGRREVGEGLAAGGDDPLAVDVVTGDAVPEGPQESLRGAAVGLKLGHAALTSKSRCNSRIKYNVLIKIGQAGRCPYSEKDTIYPIYRPE